MNTVSQTVALVLRVFAGAALAAALAATAHAQSPGGTLGKIKSSGTITLGYRDNSTPFSFT
jgi:glutamate/aspartate transport system substrate-binding protein